VFPVLVLLLADGAHDLTMKYDKQFQTLKDKVISPTNSYPLASTLTFFLLIFECQYYWPTSQRILFYDWLHVGVG